MNYAPELLALRQALVTCRSHSQVLNEALGDLSFRDFAADDLERLTKEDRRLLD